MSKRTLRVHLVEDDRPIKILLEREVENRDAMVSIRTGPQAADAFRQQASDTELTFELPGLGRVQGGHGHGQAPAGEALGAK